MYHEKLISNIFEKIIEIKDNIKVLENKDFENSTILQEGNFAHFYIKNGNSFYFSDEAYKLWKQLINKISEKVFKNKFSESYIENGLREYYTRIDSNEKVEDFFDYLNKSASDLLFFIPIYGIKLSKNELNIGLFSLKSISKIKEDIVKISPHAQPEFILNLDYKNTPDQVFIFNHYQTDKEKALDITITQTNRLIDLLNWKFSQFEPLDDQYKFISSLEPINHSYIKYITLGNKTKFGHHRKTLLLNQTLDLNDQSIEPHILNDEFEWLVSLISKDTISDYHDAILKSIHWFSKFWIENQNDNKLLYLAISLEALLSEKVSTSSFISDRVAFILGDNQTSRLELRDLVKELYEIRSNIAHGNNINTVKTKDLEKLESLVRQIIQFALDKRFEFTSLKDFKVSIDIQKYL